MNRTKLATTLLLISITQLALGQTVYSPKTIRIATFNVSMESGNYLSSKEVPSSSVLKKELSTGKNAQIKNIAEIIQRVRPDIILLNEFDYLPNAKEGIEAFIKNYLALPQNHDTKGIEYPYYYIGEVNTGDPSPYDLDNDGKVSGKGSDAWGYGLYPGHYGMALLSRYPIDTQKVRSFRHFRWSDMPEAVIPVTPESKQPWYTEAEWQEVRLPSKAMWDVPVLVNEKPVHILALHPTPPVFDGDENRNGLRNHDEIRLVKDYLNHENYIYDDTNKHASFAGERFVILGDLNANIHSSETYSGTMQQLLDHPLINSEVTPTSEGAQLNSPKDPTAAEHTALWRSRADYVLPSKKGFKIIRGSVFWPTPDDALSYLVKDRESSSDHRLVYLDLVFQLN